MLIYRNITCFFSFLFITQNECMGRVRKSQRQPRCTHTHGGGVQCSFSVKPFSLSVSFCLVQNLPRFIKFFRRPRNSHGHLPPTHCVWTCLFHNLYDISTGLPHLHPVYFWKQIYILLCHPHNLCGMSKWSSNQYLTCVFVYNFVSLSAVLFFYHKLVFLFVSFSFFNKLLWFI